MSDVKTKIKELIFECESEQEAMDLLKNYRKKNFHLVSKKIIDDIPSNSSLKLFNKPSVNTPVVALKLIKFKQPVHATNLESVWENFVQQMSKNGVEDAFTSEILKRIRTKAKFWEVHPEDHLRDIVMDAKNFTKAENLSKVLLFVAHKEELLSFFSSYQKSIAAVIKQLGIFTITSEGLKSAVKELRISPQVQTLTYNNTFSFQTFAKDIQHKVGLILVTPEDLEQIQIDELALNINDNNITLLLSPTVIAKKVLDIAAPKFIASSYTSENTSEQIFSSLHVALKHNIPLAFLWDHKQSSSILNPEAQVLKALDDLFENLSMQHFSHK